MKEGGWHLRQAQIGRAPPPPQLEQPSRSKVCLFHLILLTIQYMFHHICKKATLRLKFRHFPNLTSCAENSWPPTEIKQAPRVCWKAPILCNLRLTLDALLVFLLLSVTGLNYTLMWTSYSRELAFLEFRGVCAWSHSKRTSYTGC